MKDQQYTGDQGMDQQQEMTPPSGTAPQRPGMGPGMEPGMRPQRGMTPTTPMAPMPSVPPMPPSGTAPRRPGMVPPTGMAPQGPGMGPGMRPQRGLPPMAPVRPMPPTPAVPPMPPSGTVPRRPGMRPPRGTTPQAPAPGMEQQPRTAPPNFIPEAPNVQGRRMQGFGQFRERFRGEMRTHRREFFGCINRFTFIWLVNGNSFWFFPTFTDGLFVYGFRWRRDHWEYNRLNLNRILFFSCF